MLHVRRGPIVCVCRNVPAKMKNMNFPLRSWRTPIGARCIDREAAFWGEKLYFPEGTV